MADFEDKLVSAELTVPIQITNEFDVDRNGNSYIVTVIYTADEEDPVEVRVSLDDVVNTMADEYSDPEGYQHMYTVAHELSRCSEELREKISKMEADSKVAQGTDKPGKANDDDHQAKTQTLAYLKEHFPEGETTKLSRS